MAERRVTVRVHDDDDGLWAEVLEMPGCFAAGETIEELNESLREALSLYLADRPDAVTALHVETEQLLIDA